MGSAYTHTWRKSSLSSKFSLADHGHDDLTSSFIFSVDEMGIVPSQAIRSFGYAAVFLVFLAVQTIWGGASAAEPTFFSLGPKADHFLDREGKTTAAELVSSSGASRFMKATGHAANYGPRPTDNAVLWLRIPIPRLPSDGGSEWTLSFDELRVRRATLYLESSSGLRTEVWDGAKHGQANNRMTRFPAWHFTRDVIEEQSILLKIETASSMRAIASLQPTKDFLFAYSNQNLMFGVSFGIIAMMAFFTLSTGLLLRNGEALALASFAVAYIAYAVSHQAFLETHLWPGSVELSRVLSLSATMIIFGSRIIYIDLYFELEKHFPRVSRLSWALALLCGIIAVWVAIDIGLHGQTWLRRYTSQIGLVTFFWSLLLVGLGLSRKKKRGLIFLVAWGPVLLGGVLRIAHDVFPALGVSPYGLVLTYLLTTIGFVIAGVATAVEMHQREKEQIAEVSQSRERLRDYALSSSDSFWEADGTGRLVLASGPTSARFGLEAGKSIMGGDGLFPELHSSVANGLASERPFHIGGESQPADGSAPRYVELRARPVRNSQGTLMAWRGTVSDITDEKRRQEQEQQRQKHAAIGQLASGVAHEINNLLHPMINLARRSAATLEKSDERRHWLDIVVDSGRRASEIVATLLATSRADPQAISLAPLSDGLARAVDTIRNVIPTGITLRSAISVSGGPELPLHEVFEVVTNLTANATFAVGPGGTITVSLDRSDSSPDNLVLMVDDNGHGMDAETLRRATEAFYTTKPIGEGTGLGLYLVNTLVAKWGGVLTLDSRIGEGTRAIITLPAQRKEEQE